MSRVVNVKVSASYITERWGLPTAAELGYGYNAGWLSREDVVTVALAKYQKGMFLTPVEEELALLLSDDHERIDDQVKLLEVSDEPAERRSRYWALIVLAWLFDHRAEFRDPFEVIDAVYADFDYLEDIAPLAGITPLGPGDAPGTAGIEQRWQEAVCRWRAEYRDRDSALMRTD